MTKHKVISHLRMKKKKNQTKNGQAFFLKTLKYLGMFWERWNTYSYIKANDHIPLDSESQLWAQILFTGLGKGDTVLQNMSPPETQSTDKYSIDTPVLSSCCYRASHYPGSIYYQWFWIFWCNRGALTIPKEKLSSFSGASCWLKKRTKDQQQSSK